MKSFKKKAFIWHFEGVLQILRHALTRNDTKWREIMQNVCWTCVQDALLSSFNGLISYWGVCVYQLKINEDYITVYRDGKNPPTYPIFSWKNCKIKPNKVVKLWPKTFLTNLPTQLFPWSWREIESNFHAVLLLKLCSTITSKRSKYKNGRVERIPGRKRQGRNILVRVERDQNHLNLTTSAHLAYNSACV